MNKEYGIKATNKPFHGKEGVMSLAKTFKSIALAGMVATAPMAANDTQAADKASFNTASAQTAPFKYSIEKRDLTKYDAEVARVGMGRISAQNNGMMLIFSGDNVQLQNKVRKAGSLARDARLPVIGMAVIGKFPDIGENQFIILANGTATFPRDPALLSDDNLRDFIAEVNVKVLQPSLAAEREKSQTIAALD